MDAHLLNGKAFHEFSDLVSSAIVRIYLDHKSFFTDGGGGRNLVEYQP